MKVLGELAISLPVIVAPFSSGVTQTDLDSALNQLILGNIRKEASELSRIGNELLTLEMQMVTVGARYDAANCDRILRVMETLRDNLEAARAKFANRCEALQSERERIARHAAVAEPQIKIA